jgi:hypothetical protein
LPEATGNPNAPNASQTLGRQGGNEFYGSGGFKVSF